MMMNKKAQNQFTNHFTKEELEWLKENYYKYETLKLLTKKLNEIFGKNRSWETVKGKCNKELGLKRKKFFTEEHKQFFRDNVGKYTVKQMTDLFNKKFGQNRNADTIRIFCNRTLKLYFRSQVSVDASSASHKHPIGSEFKTKSGLIFIKTDDKKFSQNSNWKLKKRVVWEKHFGKIPPNHSIIFLDGNNNNFEIDNLRCIPNQILSKICCKNKLYGLGKITEAGIEIFETERIIKEKCL